MMSRYIARQVPTVAESALPNLAKLRLNSYHTSLRANPPLPLTDLETPGFSLGTLNTDLHCFVCKTRSLGLLKRGTLKALYPQIVALLEHAIMELENNVGLPSCKPLDEELDAEIKFSALGT